ncbi:PfkB family carbohydrate kinase [Frondihabitans cladoniiphilus]|uniref:Carbohydrate kinase family protein n=1 Tax=Frondihabitans cladoniiphilus TaxID=715785 RepID=A0ABP8W0W8_9MICO
MTGRGRERAGGRERTGGRVLVVGNAIADVGLVVPALPEPGGDVLATSTAVTAGGAFNALAAASRDGAVAVHVGILGTGPFASLVAAALESEGVLSLERRVPDRDTGFSVVLVDPTSERTFVTSVGAEGMLEPSDLQGVEVEPTDVVLVSGYSLAHPANASLVPAWLEALPESVRVVFDPSPLIATLPRAALARVLARTDVVSANAREARLWSGRGVHPADAAALSGPALSGPALSEPARAASALAALLSRPGSAALVRDGADGCVLATGSTVQRIAGFAVEAVDSTGAGDAHCGVLCAALARGVTLPEAARRANAAAALAVARRGPATAPTAAETDLLLGAGLPPTGDGTR